MKKGFIEKYIQSHWELIGKKIDFMGGGSCTLYDYNGKYIAG